MNDLSFGRDETHNFLNGISNLEEDFHSMPYLILTKKYKERMN